MGFVYRGSQRFPRRASPQRPVPAVSLLAYILRAAHAPTLRFTVGDFHPTKITAERDVKSGVKGYKRISILVGPNDRRYGGGQKLAWSRRLATEAIAILHALPESVIELKIFARGGFFADELHRIRSATETLALNSCDIISCRSTKN